MHTDFIPAQYIGMIDYCKLQLPDICLIIKYVGMIRTRSAAAPDLCRKRK